MSIKKRKRKCSSIEIYSIPMNKERNKYVQIVLVKKEKCNSENQFYYCYRQLTTVLILRRHTIFQESELLSPICFRNITSPGKNSQAQLPS